MLFRSLEKFCHSLIAEIQLGSQQQRDIEFVLHGQCLQATMDEQILRHIFSNLLSNAVKYSPVSGKISFEVDCTNQDLTFQIKDQGIGIPSEDQPRLFEPFFRAKNVGSVSGTGLGLSIVKRLVELHGGRVEVHSQVGLGTIFTVILLQKWNYCLKT